MFTLPTDAIRRNRPSSKTRLREVPKYTAILRAIAGGRTDLNEIAQSAGLANDTSLRSKVDRLISMGYVRGERNLGAKATSPYRYRLADPAFMFFHEFVAPHEALLERNDPTDVWKTYVAPRLEVYMGHVFERMAEQAYHRMRARHRLPIVREWGRWEGKDRDGSPLEVDIACTLTDGRVMTGGVKWNRKPLGLKWYVHHLRMLDRLADAGVKWAHAAREPESPLLWVAAGGFTPEFEAAVRASRDQVVLWSLSDLYRGSPGSKRKAAESQPDGAE